MKRLLLSTLVLLLSAKAFAGPLVLAGDTTLSRHIGPDQRDFFTPRARAYLDGADLFIWNAEFSGNSGDRKSKRFVFSGPVPDLRPMAFRNGVAMVANNHSLDGNEEGFHDLLRRMDAAQIPVSGVRHPDPARNYITYENNGRRFHIFSASPMIRDNPHVSSYSDLLESLERLEKREGDLVIVNLHEGIEGTTLVSGAQKKRAAELARLGADVVSFTHTHTYIDPFHVGKTLVVWGLGNFIFGGNSAWRNRNDVRALEIDPDTLDWRWIRGATRNYVLDLNP